jgi:hypothetical protein
MSLAVVTPAPPGAAAFLYLRATLRSVVWRRDGLFYRAPASAILTGCLARPASTSSRPQSRLHQLLGKPWPFPGRPPKHDLSEWTVTDDWPERVRVTQAEIDVFEAWFGDLFDGHRQLNGS